MLLLLFSRERADRFRTFTRLVCKLLLMGGYSSFSLPAATDSKHEFLRVPASGIPGREIPAMQISLTAAAKSLQSCLTLCDPIDSNPLGSSVPGILQARTLEWVAISFSNA